MSKAKTKAPLQTLAEDAYLRQLAKSKTPVSLKLLNNRIFSGTLEGFDAAILRLARSGASSVLVAKDEIKYLWEEPQTTA